MKRIIHDNKGVLLVASIIVFYFGALTLIQAISLRHGRAAGEPGKSPEPRAGIEMRGFIITAYCPGSCCNGIWAGLTATGKSIDYYAGRNMNIAAVDPAVIPMGTLFVYEGREYFAVDIGGKILGKRIDLLMPSHRETCQFGVKKNQSILLINTRRKEAFRSDARLNGLTRVDSSSLIRSVE